MGRFMAIIVAAAALATAACGATTRTTSGATTAVAAPVTSATVTFMTRDNGKDEDSAVTVQLLRSNAELGAEARMAGTEFDDNTISGPTVLTLWAPFTVADIDGGQVRVRMTPDGRDDWSFDLRMTLEFAGGARQSFFWSNIRLDNDAPERTLALAPARIP